MSMRKLIKLGLTAAVLLSLSAVSDAADAVRGPAYITPAAASPFVL